MTEESLIAFLNMQYAFISNPIKKLQLLFFMNEIYEQRAEKILKERTQYTISLYLEKHAFTFFANLENMEMDKWICT